MSYGIHIENESGRTLLDNDLNNYQVILTGSTGKNDGTLTIPSSLGDDILVFVKPNSPDTRYAYEVHTYYTTDGSGNRSVVMGSRKEFNGFSTGNDNASFVYGCDFVVVQKSASFTIPTSGFGLNTFSASNTLNYSSLYPTFRVKAFRTSVLSDTSSDLTVNWYTGSIYGEIENLYTLANANYKRWRLQKYAHNGNYEIREDWRYGRFDYPNNRYGTSNVIRKTVSFNGPTFLNTNGGHRTEIIGFAI